MGEGKRSLQSPARAKLPKGSASGSVASAQKSSLVGAGYLPAQQKALEKIEGEIRNLPAERVVSVDDRGNTVFAADGGKTSVFIPNDALEKMKGTVITHNHPNLGWRDKDPRSKGFSFSSADIGTAAIVEAKEIRAVSKGYDHSLKPPKSGWNEEFYNKKVVPSYQKHYRDLSWSYSTRVMFGRISQSQAEVDFFHELNTRVAGDTGMIYQRKEI